MAQAQAPRPQGVEEGVSDRGITRAAGGVVHRNTRGVEIEVLLIHRPHRQDWTFPKGKLEPGETHEACAVREVEEETGLRCALGPELPTISHRTRKGRLKVVRYWMMVPIGGVARPRNEVDAVRWVSLDEASELLSYDRDRELLEPFAAARLR